MSRPRGDRHVAERERYVRYQAKPRRRRLKDGGYGRRAEDHVTLVELGLELIPPVFLFFLFRVSHSLFKV